MDEANQEMPSRLVRMKTAPPDVAPLLLTPEAAARVLSVGRTTIFQAISDGRLRAVKLGRSTRISKAELERVAATGL